MVLKGKERAVVLFFSSFLFSFYLLGSNHSPLSVKLSPENAKGVALVNGFFGFGASIGFEGEGGGNVSNLDQKSS